MWEQTFALINGSLTIAVRTITAAAAGAKWVARRKAATFLLTAVVVAGIVVFRALKRWITGTQPRKSRDVSHDPLQESGSPVTTIQDAAAFEAVRSEDWSDGRWRLRAAGTDQASVPGQARPRPLLHHRAAFGLVYEARELEMRGLLFKVIRHWFVHAVAVSIVVALLISDATTILRGFSESQTPERERNPSISEAPSNVNAGRPLAELFAVAIPVDLEQGVIEPITTEPLTLLVLKPAGHRVEWIACLYVSLRSRASRLARLTLLAPFGSQPLDDQGTASACYREPFMRPVSFDAAADRVSGLSIMTIPLAPTEPGAVRVVAALHWTQTLQASEGRSRDRCYFSYDSALPSTLDRLGLRAIEDQSMDFTSTLPHESSPTVRAPGVAIILALEDTTHERIVHVTPEAGWNSELRAVWRTTPDQRRLELVAVTENVRETRLLEAQVQRSSLMTSIVVPFLVTILISRVAIGLKGSLLATKLRWLGALSIVWGGLFWLIHLLQWPPIVDTAWQWLLGLPI
jgi:hypothetical protein